MRKLAFLMFVGLFCRCSSPQSEIVGKWKFTRTYVNGKERVRATKQLELHFLSSGELLHYTEGHRYGIGIDRYLIKEDSLFKINERNEPDGLVRDTFASVFSVNDSLLIIRQVMGHDSFMYYLERIDDR